MKPPCQKYNHYIEAYQKELVGLDPNYILEIGVAVGGSLRLWKNTFQNTLVLGVDIDPRAKQHEDYRISVIVADQKDPHLPVKISELTMARGLDIIIDDGSHKAKDQRATFKLLWPMLNAGGVYVVEDLHAGYWFGWQLFEAFHGGFMKDLQRLTHLLNAFWVTKRNPSFRVAKKLGVNASELVKISFYDSICFIHKGAHPSIYLTTKDTLWDH